MLQRLLNRILLQHHQRRGIAAWLKRWEEGKIKPGDTSLLMPREELDEIMNQLFRNEHTHTSNMNEQSPLPARTSPVVDFSSIPQSLLRAVSRRFARGNSRYGRNNWRNGIPSRDFAIDRLNHLIQHALNLRDQLQGLPVPRDQQEEDEQGNADAIAWGAMFMCEHVEYFIEQERIEDEARQVGITPESVVGAFAARDARKRPSFCSICGASDLTFLEDMKGHFKCHGCNQTYSY